MAVDECNIINFPDIIGTVLFYEKLYRFLTLLRVYLLYFIYLSVNRTKIMYVISVEKTMLLIRLLHFSDKFSGHFQ